MAGASSTNNDGNDLIQTADELDPLLNPDSAFLNTGQGFFVKATSANKELVFRNDMRRQINSEHFMKVANSTTATSNTTDSSNSTTSRVWLNITNGSGSLSSQTMIGYNVLTSIGYDKGYDSSALSAGSLNFYTVNITEIDTANYVIQTRGGFDITDEVTLGFSAANAGTYTISIDHNDGVFAEGQKVFLKDNTEGIIRDLSLYDYTFTTASGTFEDRFTVIYQQQPDSSLGTDPVEATRASLIYQQNGQVKAVAPQLIQSVTIYDLNGRLIYSNNNVNNTEFSSTQLNAMQQVVIVNMVLENNTVVSKKIMLF